MNNIKNKPIGIFDSGVGGLTVLKEVKKLLPAEDIIYFGDTARVPYGNKSKSTIVKFSTENILFLLKRRVKMVVVACNTSSALALDYLKGVFSIPILGVIEAGVNRALDESTTKRIGVIGTKSTIESQSYQRKILKANKKSFVYARSCPLFVPLVEEGILDGKIANEAISMYLDNFKKQRIDTLILGCTHYPLLKKTIKGFLKNVSIVDSAQAVACHTKEVLLANNLLNESKRKTREEFFVSDEPEGFIKLAKLFLKRKISRPKIVNV
jgi:glutamate racemase